MLTDDDSTLLRAWTGGRNEDAFRRLVERYAGLVFGAARRRTGDEDLAAEAAQDVFVKLAQRAGSIRRAESLPAWLHSAAVHAAADRLRSESRHRERMKRFFEDSTVVMAGNEAEEQSWRKALPELDEAIRRLSETDRGLVLARYCQGESVAAAARRFGLSPAAAQKRGERALGKLAVLLRRRGVVLSAALLALELGARMTQAAPAGLGSRWCTAALSAKGGSSGFATAWANFMNAKAASVAVALVAMAVPVGMRIAGNARASAESTNAAGSGVARAAYQIAAANRNQIPGPAGRFVVNGLDLSILAREIRSFPPRQGRLQKELELRAVVLTLDAEQCARVAGWIAEAPSAGALSDVTFDLFSRWEQLDRQGALAAVAAMEGPPLELIAEDAVLHAWAEKDPQGMLAHFSREMEKEKPTKLSHNAGIVALRAWARSNPREALDAAMNIQGQFRGDMVNAALLGWTDRGFPEAPLDWLEKEATPEQQSLYYERLIGYLQDNNPDKAWQSLLTWPNRAVAENQACSTLNMWAGHDPDAAVAAWISGPEAWRNKHFAFNLAQVLAYANPSAARKLAVELPDPKLRETFAMIVAERLDKKATQHD